MQDKQEIFEAVGAQYRKLVRRRMVLLTVLFVSVLAAFCVDIAVGPSMLNVGDVISIILSPAQADAGSRVIVWDIRLPYSVMAILVGAALSLAGAEMQTILNNPLASPFTLGVSAAASFGAALSIILNIGIPGVPDEWMIAGNAFLFAFGSVLLLQTLSRLRGARVESIVLFGIAMVFTFNALTGIVQYIASAEALQQMIFWSMGSLVRSDWNKIQLLCIVLIVIVPFSLASSWKMTALRLGEDSARSYGVNVKRLRFTSLLRVSILSATAVAFVGTIGFIGLVGPHIARLLTGEDHRYFLPASILSGALVMSLASIVSKALVSGVVMPVGIVTALIGVPVFVVLILSKRSR
ncbi:MAG: iron ABC transporter permease [Cyclobacteriaceae bacterium]|nr:iron ABC transporter permease [Cyclobacteriaceae bacterium]